MTPPTLVYHNNVDNVKHTTPDLVTAGAFEEFVKLWAETLIPGVPRKNKRQ